MIRKGRGPKADTTTAARAFKREGLKVKLLRLREKPQRTEEQEKEREDVCGKMRKWPLMRFTDEIDLIITRISPFHKHTRRVSICRSSARMPNCGQQQKVSKNSSLSRA